MSLKYKEVEVISKFASMTNPPSPSKESIRQIGERHIRAPEQFNSNELKWDETKKSWVFEADIQGFYFHPLLTSELVLGHIESISKQLSHFDRSCMEFHLMDV